MSEPGWRLVHEDATLLVVDKAAGLLAVPGRGAANQDCLLTRLQAHWPEVLVVHRLDQPTSGLMLFARDPAMQRRLGAAFERREVEKRYIAVVAGRLTEAGGCIELPLAADWPNRPRQQVDARAGKPACTRWRRLRDDAAHGGTRLELEPLTGRTHQLRVHLAAIGHPIVGDALYAPPAVQTLAPRMLLHASSLRFSHPGRDATVTFESEAPY